MNSHRFAAVLPVLLLLAIAPVRAQDPVEPEPEPAVAPPAAPPAAKPAAPSAAPPAAKPAPGPKAVPEAEIVAPLQLLDDAIPPATRRRLAWKARYGFGVLDAPAPVLVVHGAKPGPVLCLTAAIHGDELNGIEIVRRVLQGLDPEKLSGTVIGVPVVNLPGFQRSSRYLPDRRDLNRHFPGNPEGSLAGRIAADFFSKVIRHCSHLVDIHTGSFYRANLPQLRADLGNPAVVDMTEGFGAIAVLHSPGAPGTLRRAATMAGIPAVTLEAGEPERLQLAEVKEGVKGVETLMSRMKMTPKTFSWGNPQPVFYQSRWVRVDRGGILFSDTALGAVVKAGDVLGTVTDPLSNVRTDIIAPHNGRVLGKALNQFVMPGFAAFRLGIRTSEDAVQAEQSEAELPAVPVPLPDEDDLRE